MRSGMRLVASKGCGRIRIDVPMSERVVAPTSVGLLG